MKTTKVSITGTAFSGKTAFLTGLLWQLESGEHANITPDSWRPLLGNSFEYAKIRNAMAQEEKWPMKTKDEHTFACTFTRSDRKNALKRVVQNRRWSAKQKLEFFDFSGERIADAAIAAYSEFNEWSDSILQHFDSHKAYRDGTEHFTQFLNEQTNHAKNEAIKNFEELQNTCTAYYKEALAKLFLSYKPMISPSIFLLDRDGGQITTRDIDEITRTRCAGLDGDREFAPLSAAFREQFPEITKSMANNYKAYRKQLALPLFEKIGQSDKLLFLIDLPSILSGGVGRYNDTYEIINHLGEILGDESKLFNKFAFWKSIVKKITFISTKADLILPTDIKNGRPADLLREMTRGFRTRVGHGEIRYHTCSAIRSTRAGKDPDYLIGKRINKNPERKEVEFRISPLPENWPPDWPSGEYLFELVHPQVPRSYSGIPDEINMGVIIQNIIL
jgi:predicted YcjX-like family ATPase